MRFVCDRDTFAKEIAIAQDIIASKNAFSIMSNVYLEVVDSRLIIKATDAKVGFETEIPISDGEPGALTVFCDKLMAITNSIPEGDMILEQHDSLIEIKTLSRNVRFQLKTIAGDKYPVIPDIEENQYFPLKARDLRKMISQTIFSVSNDETRFFMNGVFIEKLPESELVMVATDGRRLAYISIEEGNIPDFRPAIIPPKVLSVILKRASDEGQIYMAISEKNVFFRFGNYELTSYLIEGRFPNYQKVIPQNQRQKFTVSKNELLSALRRVSLFVERSNKVIFDISRRGLVIKSEETELGAAREELACEYDGDDVVIFLNLRYLEDPLKVMDSENITIEFSDPTRAITLRPEPASNYFHVMMPIQQP
ncbi:MAG: DNA polymerase III subunit beta [Spirochaetes bacterium ADurb.Bin110]|nr:MAG: DNA polymerase III subunit beta [Spirochaetes bacterium ADurb.Bin110]